MEQNIHTSSNEISGHETMKQEAPKKEKKGCFWWIGLVVIILVVLGILGALRKGKDAKNDTNTTNSSSTTTTTQNTTPTTTSSLPQVYRNVIGGYQIRYPSGWIVDSAAVAVVGVAFRQSDASDAGSVDVYAIPNNDNLTLDQAKTTYTNGSALLGTSNILSFRVKSSVSTTFQGLAAYEVSTAFKSKNTGQNAKGKMVVFQHAGKNYALYAHGPESSFSSDSVNFDAIINSFSFL